MRSIAIFAVLMSAAIASASSSQAQNADPADAQNLADLHCVIVSFNMLANQNSTAQVAGMISAMYWLGRLDGRSPDYDLESRIVEEIAKLKSEDLQAEAQRCGAHLQARGKVLTEMGADLRKKGQEQEQKENSR
jgi:hypothetical protein